MKKSVTIKNYKIIYLFALLFLCIAIGKLIYVSLSVEVDGMNIEVFASSRNTVDKVLYADRGVIYDSAGEVLAETVNSYTIIAYLDETRTESEDDIRHVIDKELTAKALAPILEISEVNILESLNKDKYQVELKRGITELTKSKIDELGLDGIGFTESVTRYYPSGTFASYIVGYAKTDVNGELSGELGLEKYFNTELSGINGFSEYQVDAYGYKIPNVPENTVLDEPGADIHLTIDSTIQLIAENAIVSLSKDAINEWAIMTVMDANTGAIVASATNPTFNPNDLNTITDYLNPLVSYQYEPGSTMKTFSYAASIEEGLYDGKETFMSGYLDVADVRISDFNNYGWGEISYDTGYAYSSNVATSLLALEMGASTLYDYYNDLGFGKLTGIELAGETAGKMDFYYQSELANVSFGQGLSVTPIQMLQAYSAVTNEGTVLKPYIVDKIVDSSGDTIYEGKREEVKKVYSKDTMEYMQNLMYDVVYNGLSTVYRPNNVTILGKSGTAQIAGPSGGYLEGDVNVIRSFASIFPADEPEYILYVATRVYTGGVTGLGEITTKAIEEIASYAKITDEEINHQINPSIILDNYISTKVSETVKNLENTGLNIILIGDGKYITNQYPLDNQTLFKGDKLFLKTNSDNIKMPNLTGYSLSEVKTLVNLMGIKLEVEGYGYVTSQSVAENTVISDDTVLKIVMK